MTEPPPTRPTSHRAATPASVIARKALPPLAAVTAVVLVVLLLIVLNSRPTPPGPAPGAVAQSADHQSTDAAPSSSATPSPTPSPTVSASLAPPPVSPPPATQSPAQPATVPVTVLNNSRRQGLAAHVAGEVRARGWPIRRTGNFTGRIAETTAYYAPGQRAYALRLAHQFGQIKRVLPRFRGLPGTGLTLVVTRDWTG